MTSDPLLLPWAAFAVVVPLLLGLAAVPLGSRAAALAWPGAALGLLIAGCAVAQVWLHGTTVHAIGEWAAPLGIGLVLDGLSVAFVAIAALVVAAVSLVAGAYFDAHLQPRRVQSFWPLLYFMWAGLNAVLVTADLFNAFVALELLTLTGVAMVALDGHAGALRAAVRYLLFAMAGALAYLLGVVYVYLAAGTLDMALVREAAGANDALLLAGALMSAGLMAKTALFPLHAWLAPAHAAAPAPASAMLSALVVKASLYLLLRLWFDVLPDAATPALLQLFGALGAGGIVFGSLLALRQQRLKPLIAYSTVAQLGYVFLAFPLAGQAGTNPPWSATAWSGGVLHALAHAPAKAALFLAAGLMIAATGRHRIEDLAGLAHRMPLAAGAFALAALSLTGLPPGGGFAAKLRLIAASLESGQWWWAPVIVLGGALACAYLLRVLLVLFGPAAADAPGALPVARHRALIVLLLAAAALMLGPFAQPAVALLLIGRPDTGAG